MFSRKRGLKAKKRDQDKDSINAAQPSTPSSFFARILGNARGTASCIDLSKSTTFSISGPPPVDDPPTTASNASFLNGEKVSIVSLPDASASTGEGASEKRRSRECMRSETMPGSNELMVNGRNSAFQPIGSSSGWYSVTQYEEAIPVSIRQEIDHGKKRTESDTKKKVLSSGKPNREMSSPIPSVGPEPVSTSSSSPESRKSSSIKRWKDVSRLLPQIPVDVSKKSFAIRHDDSSFSSHVTDQDLTGEDDDLREFVNAVVERAVERVWTSDRYEQMVDAVVRRISERFERRLDGIEQRVSMILSSVLLPTDSADKVNDRSFRNDSV